MRKNIVVCSDGTGNVANKGRGTNVFKLYECVDTRVARSERDEDDSGPTFPQIAIYCDGVGTDKLKILRALGGAFGFGFSRNVKRLYSQILRVYQPGDQIYLFGFSRGAYTVRVLAGLIGAAGLPRPERIRNPKSGIKPMSVSRFVTEAYSAYRGSYRAMLAPFWDLVCFWRWRWRNIPKLRKDYLSGEEEPKEPPIALVGVWDTVDAVGFPIIGVSTLWDHLIFGFRFRERGLTPSAACARHALSIDDERSTFHPTLWDQDDSSKDRIKQVWFAGVHSNVGGGYPKQGVSHRPLVWLLREAEESGLDFAPGKLAEFEKAVNVHDHIYDSRAGLACYYRYSPRDIKKICDDRNTPPEIDISVIQRIAVSPEGYAPGTWPKRARVVDAVEKRRHKNIEAAIRSALGERRRPLSEVEFWVGFRSVVQWCLILTTIFLVIALLASSENKPPAGGWDAVKYLWNEITRPDRNPLVLIGLPAALLAYVLGLIARIRIERHLENFWDGVRANIYGALTEIPDSAADETDSNSKVISEKPPSKKSRPPVQPGERRMAWATLQWSHPVTHSLAAAFLLLIVFFAGSFLQHWWASGFIDEKSSYTTPNTDHPYRQPTGYSHEFAINYMETLEDTGRTFFANQLKADLVFPLLFGATFFLILARALQLIEAAKLEQGSRALRASCWSTLVLVAIAMVADWFENGIWLEQLSLFPDQLNESRLTLASTMTSIKIWGLLLASVFTLLLTWIVHRKFRTAVRKNPSTDTTGSTGGAGVVYSLPSTRPASTTGGK